MRGGRGARARWAGAVGAVAFATATMLAGPAARAEPAPDPADVTAADSQQVFEQALSHYLVADDRAPNGTRFDRAAARRDGASEDLLSAGATYNRMSAATSVQQSAPGVSRAIGLPIWGNWCGPGHGGGTPKDLLDAACRDHDRCYASAGYFACDCDRQLIAAITRDYGRMRPAERVTAIAVKTYFSVQDRVTC